MAYDTSLFNAEKQQKGVINNFLLLLCGLSSSVRISVIAKEILADISSKFLLIILLLLSSTNNHNFFNHVDVVQQ